MGTSWLATISHVPGSSAEPAAGQWRGTIAPVDEDAWWHSYATLMLHLARLAQDEGATSLAIGSELVSRERSRLRWLELIDRVRHGRYRRRPPDREPLRMRRNWWCSPVSCAS